jgi:CDP-4-dehydro-6-deoxyglucose reductase, E1
MNLDWPLMKDTITFRDRLKMAKFILTTSRLTNGPRVKKFEKEWSEWLGADHSLFVSSGSTANYLLLAAVKENYGLQDGDKVLVPACTWMTNVAPVIQLGLQPIFCDINLENFSFDIADLDYIKDLHPDIKVVFVSHLLGFPGDNEIIESMFPNAYILDDVCESHGCLDLDFEKVGSNSIGSTFSFYFGHHMTTIEGGMVSTNSPSLYELMRMKRSHGLARESSPDRFDIYKNQYKDVDDKFMFVTDGYNFRNHEVCAVLGSSQLKRLDKMIAIRRQNYDYFLDRLQCLDDLFHMPALDFETNSSFCFPLVAKDHDTSIRVKTVLNCSGVESRPIVSGNLLRHPFLKGYSITTAKQDGLLNVDIAHNNGVYMGNSHFVDKRMIARLFDAIEDNVV